MQNVLDEVVGFSDLELVGRLERLVKTDRALSAELVVHLGEVDARKLYCELGFSSMFNYCRSALGMSEAEAYLRLQAARVGRRFPLVVERLGVGAVHLSAIKMLAPHLTAENYVELLERVAGMSKRQIEVLIAELAPKPDVPARLRKLPSPRVSLGTTAVAVEANGELATCGTVTPPTAAEAVSPAAAAFDSLSAPKAALPTFVLESPRSHGRCTPLSPGRFELKLTLGKEGHDALDQLVELFRHQNPKGDLASIVERALKELLERTIKRRFGQAKTAKPRATCQPAPATPEREIEAANDERRPQSRHIPKAVRCAVYARDMGQCTFEGSDGRRCTERGFLEMHHHHTTFARGGAATVENLRLACRVHNAFMADQDYGRVFMRAKLRGARGETSVPEQSSCAS